MVWYVSLYNISCPYREKTDNESIKNTKKLNCSYPNKMYNPKYCHEEACPIREHTRYNDND